MPIEVPRKSTSLSKNEAYMALSDALEMEGIVPEPSILGLLLAQIWIENGAGKSFVNYNWGNLTATEKYGGTVWRPPWYTVNSNSSSRDKNLHSLMNKGQAPRAFLAFNSHEDGAREYVQWLKKDRFRPILDAAAAGNPALFAAQIVDTGYCPDCNKPSFANSIASIARQFSSLTGWAPDDQSFGVINLDEVNIYGEDTSPSKGPIAMAVGGLLLAGFLLSKVLNKRRA